MTVKLRFRDLSGQIINGSFPNDAKVVDVCCFLSKRLKSSSYIIYLISPNPKQLFYKNEESVQVLFKQKLKCIFFFRLNKQTTTKRPDTPDSQKKMIIPPKSAMNAYNNFMEIKNIRREHRIYYFKYASVLNSVPNDMEEKVKQVAQFGYDKEDCREALRDAHFNVNEAVEILIRRHRNLTDEEANEPPPNMNTVLNFLRFMLLRGSHNNSDDDDSEDMIEEEEEDYSSDDSSTESINENENNQTNNPETESNNETNNQENTDNKNENQRILTPIPPSSASSSPRTSINRLRIDNAQEHESANQNSSDESENQSQKLRPIIINPRLSRITRPNIQSNQRKITIPRNIQPKKTGK